MKALDVLRFPPAGPGSLLSRVGQYFVQNKLPVINKTIAYSEFFHQQVIVGLTSASFFTGAVDSSGAGQNTNLATFIRPQYEHMLITQVKVYCGAATAVEASDWELGVPDNDVKNGQWSLTTNNNKVIQNMPFTSTLDYAATGDSDAGYILPVPPVIWAGQNDIEITCTWPVILATTSNQNMRIVLCGYAAI